MSAAKATSLRGDGPRAGRARGFTLIEMLVVLAIIALLLGASLPSIRVLFTSGADADAYNLLTAQLRAARGLAIQQQTHAAVHIRLYDDTMTDADPGLTGAFFLVLLVEEEFVPGKDIDEDDEVFNDPGDPDEDNIDEFGTVRRFVLAPGSEPRKLPRPMACGELRTKDDQFSQGYAFITNMAPYEYMNIANDDDVKDFTTVTVVFTPAGGLARDYPVRLANRVVADPDDDTKIDFTKSRILFADFTPPPEGAGSIGEGDLAPLSVWRYPPLAPNGAPDPEEGAENLVLFDYGVFNALPANDDDRSDYLRSNGRILAINPYTGQMLGGE